MNSELAQLEQTTMAHYNAPVETAHSLPAAQSLVSRLKVIGKPVPLAVQRFMDRMSAPKGQSGLRNKLARDLHSAANYDSLPTEKQSGVDNLAQAINWHNPASAHPYAKAGLSFAQGRHILVATYKEMGDAQRADYTQDVRHGLNDFATGLEKDLDEAAKRGGFYQEYSGQLKELRAAIQNRMRGTQ